MSRRSKIVATLGPSSSSREQIAALIHAGMDVARLNFSHGSADDHRERARVVREEAAKQGRFVALLGDLQGPKIRIARFAENKIELAHGAAFRLSMSHDRAAGNAQVVGLDYPDLVKDCAPGDELLLDDGRIVLRVLAVDADGVDTRVEVAGPLSNNKGINKRGGGISAEALTAKDRADIQLAAELAVDYLAVSFPREAADMQQARSLLEAAGGHAGLVAKIERAEAVAELSVLEDLIRASDAVMVARGDLGVEIGDAELIGIQKLIISRARALNKGVITATQMMESMTKSPMPTRAEVSDVANAVIDHTDAVMLSGETAAGDYPVEAVAAMARICIGAEKHAEQIPTAEAQVETFARCDQTIALTAMYAANHFPGVKAIVSLTESGATPLTMSRMRSQVPIFALSPHASTQHRVALYRGVYPIPFDINAHSREQANQAAVDELLKRGLVQPGDWLVLTKGDYNNTEGGTNTLKIICAGDKVF